MATPEIDKIVVAGCSYSDYTEVDRVYGEILSELYDVEYLHHAAGCGSNYRIWRVIMNDIMSGIINENSLLIIQYTTPERKEYFSRIRKRNDNIRDDYAGGSLIRFKLSMWQGYDIKPERRLYKLLEDNFISETYDNEMFTIFHEMFKEYLKNKNISTIFLRTGYNSINHNESYNIVDGYWLMNSKYIISEKDTNHLSAFGHEALANHLKSYIDTQQWINI